MGAWTLHLKFNGDNTDYYSGILDGAVIKECVGAKGKHAMQSCSVSIWDSILAAKIFNSKDDIEAKIHNGDTVVFEGVIRPYARLSAQMAYENPIELEVIDYSQILRYYIYTDLSDLNLDLSDSAKEKIIETRVYEDISLSTLIRNLFTLAKIDKKVSIEIPEIDIRKDYFCLEAGEYLDDIIAELLYEYCLDYRFTPGKLTVFSTKVVDKDKKAIEPTETLSDFNLTFEVNRADQSDDGVKVNYGIYRVKRMKLYSVDTRFDNYPDFYMWTAAHYSGYYYNHKMNKTLDNLPKVSWSFGENMSNNTILNISNIECKAGLQDERGVWYQGFCKEYDKDGGKPYIQYDGWFNQLFGNGWGFTMEVYGLVFYRMSEDASTELIGLSPTNVTTDYIESADDAGILAINIQARNEKAAYTYGFTSWTEVAPGTIVALEENKVTGLSAIVRIISRTLDPKTGLYTYEAEGAGEVTIPELFSQSRGDNGSIIDSDGRSYIIDIELSKDMIVSSKDKVTATASGMLFSSYGCTPHWELNGEALSDTELSITLKATQLQVGDNTLRCYAEYEGETIEKSVTIMLVSAESKYLDYDLSSWIVRCYADGYVMDDTPITLTARSVESISLYINDNLITSGNPISYSITPSDFMDNERSYIKIRLVAGNVTRSTRIMKSLLSGELELTTDKNEIDFYADDIEVEDGAEITVTAKATNFKDYPTLISWNGSIEKGTSDTIVEKIPASVLRGRSSITVTAKIGTLVRTIAISKNTLQGSIDITADKTVLNYYADDIEKTEGDKITVKAVATNYKASPTIEMDGTAVATGSSGSAAYDVLATSLYGKSGAVITAKVGDISKSIAITKSYEQGTISIECDRPVFDYYADNVPHNSTDISTLTIKQSGYSKMPALYINGTETEYQSKNASGEGSGTYSVKATELINLSALTAKIQILEEVQLIALTKKLDSPMIRLSVSEPVAEYYYDNVSITNDIEAEVSYSGLFYAPLLKAGNTPIQLSDEGKGIIPISLFDDVDSGLSVMAYAQKNITYGTSVSIQKQKRQLKLSLGISGAQFTYDNNGNASPEYISITNNTEGLSNKSKVLLLVGGESKSWDESGAYKITPGMITGRYIAVSIGYGSDTTTAIITKTFDGKAEDYQYSKTKSFRIYPDDEYGFIYSDEFLEYNGERFAWVVPWSVKIPDVSSNEYLWRRSRTDEDSDWQYTRITGIKGEDGENAGGEYLGHYTSAPTKRPDGNDLENGDYYLDTSKDGEPLPYRYKDGGWVLITSSDPDWSAIASNTMNDVNNYAGSLLSTSAYYGYFQLLSAQKAFIQSLGTQEITLTDGGSIMSENYKSSNGAEGFRIDSDGNVDFNEGTFRGSFANGLSFIPPTRFKIDKDMSQKEAYQTMKKAGIVAGIYDAGSYIKSSKDFIQKGYSGVPVYDNGYITNAAPAFICLDYREDNLDFNVPVSLASADMMTEEYYPSSDSSTKLSATTNIFGLMFNIWAIGFEHYILMLGHAYKADETSSSSKLAKLDGFYLLTKAKLEELYKDLKADEKENIDTAKTRGYLTRIDSMDNCYVNIYNKPLGLGIYPYYDYDTKTTYILADDKALNGTIHLHHFTDGDSSVSYDGTISTGYSFSQIARWIMPCAWVHKIDGKFQIAMYGGSSSSDGRFHMFQSDDMSNWTAIRSFPVLSNDFLFDAMTINGRTFATRYSNMTDSSGSSSFKIGFYELLDDDTFAIIPREDFVDEIAINTMPICNLFCHDGKIYGSLGMTFFSYDVESSTFTDRTMDLVRDVDIEAHYSYESNAETKNRIEITPYDGVSSYKGDFIRGAFFIDSIRWDYKENALFISVTQSLFYAANTPIFYYPDEDRYRLFSIPAVLFGFATMLTFSLISDGTRRVYCPQQSNLIFLSGIPFSTPAVSVDNLSLNEFRNKFANAEAIQSYCSQAESSWYLMYYYIYHRMIAVYGSDYSLLYPKDETYKSGDSNITYTMVPDFYADHNRHMIDIDSDTIDIDSPFPIFDCRKMIIRETEDELQIILPSSAFNLDFNYIMLCGNHVGLGMIPYLSSYLDMMYMQYIISTDMQPFLRIKKDSLDPVNATFFWNFPAQLTTREGLGKVSNQLISYEDIQRYLASLLS